MLMICLPGEAACPWMTGCKNATSALKRSLPPISETPLNCGTAGGIAMKTTLSDDCSENAHFFSTCCPRTLVNDWVSATILSNICSLSEIVLTKAFRHGELQVFGPCDDCRMLIARGNSATFASEQAAVGWAIPGASSVCMRRRHTRPAASKVIPVELLTVDLQHGDPEEDEEVLNLSKPQRATRRGRGL